jgi:hypothetical protein
VRKEMTNVRLWLRELRQWLGLAGIILKQTQKSTTNEKLTSRPNIEATYDQMVEWVDNYIENG